MSRHPHGNVVDVYASVLLDFPFKPEMHVYYGEKMISMRDGLPKYRDVPAEMGGSGEVLPD